MTRSGAAAYDRTGWIRENDSFIDWSAPVSSARPRPKQKRR